MKTKLIALDLVISRFTNTLLKDDAMTLPAFNSGIAGYVFVDRFVSAFERLSLVN
ncbi:MAG: hypothetical protein PHP53_03755 [Prolixibacteraceae bacterium]|nr:hypothetical protein [Prolixibacteraceae bacterium]